MINMVETLPAISLGPRLYRINPQKNHATQLSKNRLSKSCQKQGLFVYQYRWTGRWHGCGYAHWALDMG